MFKLWPRSDDSESWNTCQRTTVMLRWVTQSGPIPEFSVCPAGSHSLSQSTFPRVHVVVLLTKLNHVIVLVKHSCNEQHGKSSSKSNFVTFFRPIPTCSCYVWPAGGSFGSSFNRTVQFVRLVQPFKRRLSNFLAVWLDQMALRFFGGVALVPGVQTH